MSTHKYVDRICAVLIAVILAAALVVYALFGQQTTGGISKAYATGLFDTGQVHTIEIEMTDWEGFLETCEDEEYAACTVTIDGETVQNTAIRAKGNTSLSSVKAYGNQRYSFKLEFDHYSDGGNYQGLDKLSLNNIIQDNTYMKDYLSYQLMASFGVSAPLCSYAYLTVNGEDWGLYLAVEGVEESFLERNYGNSEGDLYKPDSMDMGGGRGAGGDFTMPEEFDPSAMTPDQTQTGQTEETQSDQTDQTEPTDQTGQTETGQTAPDQSAQTETGQTGQEETDQSGQTTAPPDLDQMPQPPETTGEGTQSEGEQGGFSKGGGPGPGGMGSDDVKLKYIDDDPDSYSNIFDNAKTDVTDADQTRLIGSLEALSQGDTSVVDTEAVLRYFVVHNFLCNEDSYTGSMVHNYYLYETDGVLSMIPWDYNLAFGGFQGGSDATSTVNTPIDTPVSGGATDDRPMIDWIFQDETATQQYHALFDQFLTEHLENGALAAEIQRVKELIAPYVEQDPTKFCTYEAFETGTEALAAFCQLRAESIRGQLAGTIPATTDGQTADSTALVDASDLDLSALGSMGSTMGGQGGRDGQRPEGMPTPPGQDGAAAGQSPPTQGSGENNPETPAAQD